MRTLRSRRWALLIPAGLIALIVVDAVVGVGYRTGTRAAIEIIAPRSPTARRAIVVFPGW
jgi:hypothetical protein